MYVCSLVSKYVVVLYNIIVADQPMHSEDRPCYMILLGYIKLT